MRVVFGSDHAAYDLKEDLRKFVKEHGYEVVDVGTSSTESVDYPDFAEKLAEVIREGRAERGILLCGSGVGACVAANKIPGIRAGTCHDIYSSHQAVEHDDVNVIVLGARVIGVELARELVLSFLNAEFSGAERHIRRLNKVKKLEEKY